MRAAYYEEFGGPVSILELPDPEPLHDGVVIQVEATGLSLSDRQSRHAGAPVPTNAGNDHRRTSAPATATGIYHQSR